MRRSVSRMLLAIAVLAATVTAAAAPPNAPAPVAADPSPSPPGDRAATASAHAPPPPVVAAPEPALAVGLSDFRHELARTLAKGTAPRDWALAAQLLETRPPSGAKLRERLQLLRRAAAAAPTDRIVQALWANACSGRRMCGDRRALIRIDPGNGVAWVPLVGAAWHTGDLRRFDAGLERLAASGRFNEHFGEAIGAWRDLFVRHPPPHPTQSDPEREADYVLSLTFDEAKATALPDLVPIIDACSTARHPDAPAHRFATCGKVGRLLMDRAQTLPGRMAGVLILANSGTASSADDARVRTIRWRFAQMGKVYARLAADPVARQNYMSMVQANDSEMAAVSYELAIAGAAPTPPADWQPPGDEPPVPPQDDTAAP